MPTAPPEHPLEAFTRRHGRLTVNRRGRGLGWRPDPPDPRDFTFTAATKTKLPATFSLRAELPPIWDQGQLGSCVGHGVGAALMAAEVTEKMPSRMFIYYCARAFEGTTATDAGATIRDGIKAVAKLGAPPEADWPYIIARFAQRPPAKAFADALLEVALDYHRVPRNTIKRAIHETGRPVVLGATLFDSFDTPDTARTGIIPMPAPGERIDGGHCFDVIGWDDDHPDIEGGKAYECRNSWSPRWGDQGHFWLPARYLEKPGLASDFWLINKATVS